MLVVSGDAGVSHNKFKTVFGTGEMLDSEDVVLLTVPPYRWGEAAPQRRYLPQRGFSTADLLYLEKEVWRAWGLRTKISSVYSNHKNFRMN